MDVHPQGYSYYDIEKSLQTEKPLKKETLSELSDLVTENLNSINTTQLKGIDDTLKTRISIIDSKINKNSNIPIIGNLAKGVFNRKYTAELKQLQKIRHNFDISLNANKMFPPNHKANASIGPVDDNIDDSDTPENVPPQGQKADENLINDGNLQTIAQLSQSIRHMDDNAIKNFHLHSENTRSAILSKINEVVDQKGETLSKLNSIKNKTWPAKTSKLQILSEKIKNKSTIKKLKADLRKQQKELKKYEKKEAFLNELDSKLTLLQDKELIKTTITALPKQTDPISKGELETITWLSRNSAKMEVESSNLLIDYLNNRTNHFTDTTNDLEELKATWKSKSKLTKILERSSPEKKEIQEKMKLVNTYQAELHALKKAHQHIIQVNATTAREAYAENKQLEYTDGSYDEVTLIKEKNIAFLENPEEETINGDRYTISDNKIFELEIENFKMESAVEVENAFKVLNFSVTKIYKELIPNLEEVSSVKDLEAGSILSDERLTFVEGLQEKCAAWIRDKGENYGSLEDEEKNFFRELAGSFENLKNMGPLLKDIKNNSVKIFSHDSSVIAPEHQVTAVYDGVGHASLVEEKARTALDEQAKIKDLINGYKKKEPGKEVSKDIPSSFVKRDFANFTEAETHFTAIGNGFREFGGLVGVTQIISINNKQYACMIQKEDVSCAIIGVDGKLRPIYKNLLNLTSNREQVGVKTKKLFINNNHDKKLGYGIALIPVTAGEELITYSDGIGEFLTTREFNEVLSKNRDRKSLGEELKQKVITTGKEAKDREISAEDEENIINGKVTKRHINGNKDYYDDITFVSQLVLPL